MSQRAGATIHITGIVQGVGFRPFVFGLAQRLNLTGWVLQFGSRVFRRLQTGVVSQYAMVIAVGMFVLVFFYVVVALQS